MNWVKKQCTVIVTVAILLSGGLVTWGKIKYICQQVESKADKASVTRELDLIQKTLDRIENKLDNHMQK